MYLFSYQGIFVNHRGISASHSKRYPPKSQDKKPDSLLHLKICPALIRSTYCFVKLVSYYQKFRQIICMLMARLIPINRRNIHMGIISLNFFFIGNSIFILLNLSIYCWSSYSILSNTVYYVFVYILQAFLPYSTNQMRNQLM